VRGSFTNIFTGETQRASVSSGAFSRMANIKFIHAADIHLGRPFSGLRRSSPELGDLFLRAGYDAWDRIVTTAIDQKADFLTLAGDVFDAASPAVRARVAFRNGVERLYDAGIPVYLAAGNHDPLQSFPESLRNLPGLHLFGPNPEGARPAGEEQTDGVMIFGAGFQKAVVTDNLVRKFRRDPGIELAIGVVHTNVAGTSGHENYAPCTVDDLKAAGLDIWCLGHVHSCLVLSKDPLILYPGTSQGAHINESGPRGCHLIIAEAGGAAEAKFIPLAPVRWLRVDLDVSDCQSAEDVVDAAETLCPDAALEADGLRALVVRLNLTGQNGPQGLRATATDPEFFDVLCERLAQLSLPVFPESLRYSTRSPINLNSLEGEESFLGDFLELCRSSAEEPAMRYNLLASVQAELSKKLHRRYIPSQLDLERLKDDSQAVEILIDEAADLVAQMFSESDDIRF
jgi:DNA repair exonuclease SbcCD nuclease subunit